MGVADGSGWWEWLMGGLMGGLMGVAALEGRVEGMADGSGWWEAWWEAWWEWLHLKGGLMGEKEKGREEKKKARGNRQGKGFLR
jgi:hypothetical protein